MENLRGKQLINGFYQQIRQKLLGDVKPEGEGKQVYRLREVLWSQIVKMRVDCSEVYNL